jgi:signal transduction histidine kinase
MFTRIRWQLVGWTVLVIGVLLLALGIIVYASLARSLMDAVDSSLETSSRTALVEFNEASETDLARAGYQGGLFFLLVDTAGTVLENPQEVDVTALPAYLLVNPRRGFTTVDLPMDAVRIYVGDFPRLGEQQATLIVGQSLGAEREAERRLLLILLLGGGIGLLLSFLAAAFLAGRALIPIEGAFRRQQEFVADASHELRTPLTILHAATDLLVERCDPSQGTDKELLEEVRQEVVHMERLTRDLLTLAGSDRGELQLALGRVDLGALARELQQRVGVLAQAREITLGVDLDGPTPVVEGDPDRLQQVGLILLDNAFKHTPSGGYVRLVVGRDGAQGLLRVEDTGEGIPHAHLARVFDRFYRVDRARTRSTGGAGLGLAIAYTLVAAHRGRIALNSRPDGGTLATIWLPLAADEQDSGDVPSPTRSLTSA